MGEKIPKTLNYSFSGRNVLITSGGQGIGRALVERLYADGANVFVLEQDSTLVAELKEKFPKAQVEEVDICEWETTQKITESFGPIHHLVNNAGIGIMEPLFAITEDTYTKQMDVNLKGMFCVSQAVAKGMIAGGKLEGCTMVNVASLASILASCYTHVYSVSKAGVVMLTKTLAVELGKHNIRINCISPTAVDTPLMRENMHAMTDPGLFVNRQPLARNKVMELDEMVNKTLFLLSPLSSMITGHNLVVDGGISLC